MNKKPRLPKRHHMFIEYIPSFPPPRPDCTVLHIPLRATCRQKIFELGRVTTRDRTTTKHVGSWFSRNSDGRPQPRPMPTALAQRCPLYFWKTTLSGIFFTQIVTIYKSILGLNGAAINTCTFEVKYHRPHGFHPTPKNWNM